MTQQPNGAQWPPPYGPPPPVPPQKPRFGLGARIAMIIGGVVLIAAVSRCGSGGSEARPTSSSPPAATPTAARQAPAPAPTSAVAPATLGIGDGTWLIGSDMQPGTYRSTGAKQGLFEFCSWSTKAGPSSNSDILDFGTANANEPMIVAIDSKVKAFTTSNCEPWTKTG